MANEYSISAKITADSSGFEKGINRAKNALNGFSKKVNEEISKLGKGGLSGSIAGVAASLGGIGLAVGAATKTISSLSKKLDECTSAFKTQELAERALKTAVDNSPYMTGTAVKALKEYATQVQKNSNLGDEQIIPMMTKLVASGRTVNEVMRIIAVATDMSATGTVSFEQAVSQLNQTMNGTIGTLGRQYAELQGLSTEALRSGEAVEILGQKFAGLADKTKDSSKQLANAKGDFKEALGRLTAPSADMWNNLWNTFYTGGTNAINRFSEYFEQKVTGKAVEDYLNQQFTKIARAQKGITYKDVAKDVGTIEDLFKNYLDETQLIALQKRLESQKKLTEAQELQLKLAKRIVGYKQQETEEQEKLAASAAKNRNSTQEEEKAVESATKEQKDWNGLIRNQEIEIAGINEDYEKQLDLQLWAIENERQSALSSATSAEERAEINKYYDNEIYLARKKIRKKDEKEEKKSWKDRVKDIGKTLAGFAKTVATVFKKVGEVISKVFTKSWEIVKGAVSKIASGFKSLVGLSVSDTLDALLKFEDGILTFFVETLPQLPGFIKSVLDSVGTLFNGLKDSIDVTQLSDIIENMVDYVASNLPDLVDDFFNVLSQIMGGALNGLNKWLESGGSDKLSKGVSKMFTSLSKNTRKFVEDGLPVIIKVIQDIADGVIDWLDNGGIEDILAIILNIQKQLETFVTENLDKIADLIAGHVEDFGNFIADSMESANKTLPKLISAVLKVVVAIIDAIAKAFEDESFVKSIVQSIEDVIKEIINILPNLLSSIVNLIVNIITALVPELPGLIIRVVNEIAKAIPEIASQLASSLFDGVLSIFKQIFTGDFWSQAFSDIGEGISGAFSDGGGYGKNSTGSTAGDLAVDLLVPGGFLRHFFATGTNSASRGLAVVGEAGPELVNFRGGEQVLNNHNTQKALDGMGGSTNNFNVTFNNLQDTSAFTMMQQLKAYNRQMAINGII